MAEIAVALTALGHGVRRACALGFPRDGCVRSLSTMVSDQLSSLFTGGGSSFIQFQSYRHGTKDEGKKQRRQISIDYEVFWKSWVPPGSLHPAASFYRKALKMSAVSFSL